MHDLIVETQQLTKKYGDQTVVNNVFRQGSGKVCVLCWNKRI